MDRVSSIFARFEPSHVLTSDVIGHVLPRASVGGSGVFYDPGATQHIKLPPLQASLLPSMTGAHAATLSSSPLAPNTAPVAPQKTPLDYLKEASLTRRMNNVDACTTKSASPTVRPKSAAAASIPSAGSALKEPLPPSRTVPSVKTIQSSAPGAPKPKRKRIRLKNPRRREQCRTNQARYRKKQSENAKMLEVSVEQLRQEIPMLEMQHSRLISNVKPSAWYAVVEYFHLFRNGVRQSDQILSGPEAWLQKSEAEQQVVFLRSSMADNVVLGEQRGVDVLIKQWTQYTTYFDDLQFQLEDMTKISEDFISATASINVTISDSTLQFVFPHLLAGENGRRNEAHEDKKAILRSKLVGQRLVLPCRLCFEWDPATKQIVRMENTMDIFPSLLLVLETIENTAFVLEQTLIAQDGAISKS